MVESLQTNYYSQGLCEMIKKVLKTLMPNELIVSKTPKI